MNAVRMSLLVCALLPVGMSIAVCQVSPLRGSSSIEINLGLWNETTAGQHLTLSGIRQSAKTSGFVGGIQYGYWMREYLALTIAASMLSGEASSTISPATIKQHASSVISLLIGMKYFIPQPEPEDRVRPYVAVGVGSYIGSEAENSLVSQAAHSESVLGGRAGVGLDALIGSWFKLNVSVGYNVMTDFKTPVAARTNYNGYDMSIGFGFVF